MREHWLDDHVGDEASVRPEFEAELAEALHERWHTPDHPRELQPAPGGRRPRGAIVAVWGSVAAAALVVGVIALTNDDAKPHVTGSTSDVPTSMPSTSVAPTTSMPLTVTEPPSSVPGDGEQISLPVAHTPEQQTVLDYLVALAESRWDDAAKLLGEGGLEWEGRADLRPLFGTDGTLPNLPAALRDWCASPALCQVPTSLATSGYDVVATFAVEGVSRASLFTGGTFEGSPLVRGLPLRLPPGVSLADTVECPTDGVDRTVYADLDGDGWAEVVDMIADTGSTSGTGVQIVACGTTLAVAPLGAESSVGTDSPVQMFVLPGSALDERRDHVLLTYPAPEGSASIVIADDQRLFASGHYPYLDFTSLSSLGCADASGDGTDELVLYTYRYVGGSDLSNSTALEWEATELLEGGGAGGTYSGSFALPAQEQQAFRVIAGYCGNLPIQTG